MSAIYRITTANPVHELARGMERYSAPVPKNGRAGLNGGGTVAAVLDDLRAKLVRIQHAIESLESLEK